MQLYDLKGSFHLANVFSHKLTLKFKQELQFQDLKTLFLEMEPT